MNLGQALMHELKEIKETQYKILKRLNESSGDEFLNMPIEELNKQFKLVDDEVLSIASIS